MHVSAYSETISDDYFETNFDRQQSRFYNVSAQLPAILGHFSDRFDRRAFHDAHLNLRTPERNCNSSTEFSFCEVEITDSHISPKHEGPLFQSRSQSR